MNELISILDWWTMKSLVLTTFHALFLPLTVGMAFIIACIATSGVLTQSNMKLRSASFWLRVFGINYIMYMLTEIFCVISVAENWSQLSIVSEGRVSNLLGYGMMGLMCSILFYIILFHTSRHVSHKHFAIALWGAFLSTTIASVSFGMTYLHINVCFALAVVACAVTLGALFVYATCTYYNERGRYLDVVRATRTTTLRTMCGGAFMTMLFVGAGFVEGCKTISFVRSLAELSFDGTEDMGRFALVIVLFFVCIMSGVALNVLMSFLRK